MGRGLVFISVTCCVFLAILTSVTTENVSSTIVVFNTSTTTPQLTKNWRDHYCSMETNTYPYLFGFVIILIFIPITVFGNAVVFFVVWFSPNLRKQTTYMFLCSLAVVDTLIGLTMSSRAYLLRHNGFWCSNLGTCWFHVLNDVFLSVASCFHLFVLAIDRYASLKYVYRYNSIMTRRRKLSVIVSIWVVSIVFMLLGIFQWKHPNEWSISYLRNVFCLSNNREYYITMFLLVLLIPITIMIYLYAYIYRVAVYHIDSIVQQQEKATSEKEKLRKKKQCRVLRTVILVFVCYFMCWFPSIVLSLWTFYNTTNGYGNKRWFQFTRLFVIDILPPFNSCTNPFIYVLLNEQFKRYAKILLYRIIGKRLPQTGETWTNTKATAVNNIRNRTATTTKTNSSSALQANTTRKSIISLQQIGKENITSLTSEEQVDSELPENNEQDSQHLCQAKQEGGEISEAACDDTNSIQGEVNKAFHATESS